MQTSASTQTQVCTMLQAAGAKGISVFIASGDSGVWGSEGTGTRKFNPDFPANCPYVTAVGGSEFSHGYIGTPETCSIYSGGGFSNQFAAPTYQTTAISHYFSTQRTLPAASYYNRAGRGYPDIVANFGSYAQYCIFSGGYRYAIGGTSASAPVVAAMFANLNSIQLNANKPALGFVNPWLYSTAAAHPTAFNDLTSGCNTGGYRTTACFNAAAGWDPCSGLGTINYANLKQWLP